MNEQVIIRRLLETVSTISENKIKYFLFLLLNFMLMFGRTLAQNQKPGPGNDPWF